MILANCILVGVLVLSSGFVGVLVRGVFVGSIYYITGILQSNNEAAIVRTQHCYTIGSYYLFKFSRHSNFVK